MRSRGEAHTPDWGSCLNQFDQHGIQKKPHFQSPEALPKMTTTQSNCTVAPHATRALTECRVRQTSASWFRKRRTELNTWEYPERNQSVAEGCQSPHVHHVMRPSKTCASVCCQRLDLVRSETLCQDLSTTINSGKTTRRLQILLSLSLYFDHGLALWTVCLFPCHRLCQASA